MCCCVSVTQQTAGAPSKTRRHDGDARRRATRTKKRCHYLLSTVQYLTRPLASLDISRLDSQLAQFGKRVCTSCVKICTTRRAHNCHAARPVVTHTGPSPSASATLAARVGPAVELDVTATPPRASRPVTTPTAAAAPAIDDWPDLVYKLKFLRHTFVPAAVSCEYRLLFAKLLKSFNRAHSHVRRDLALRTLIAGVCVTTRDLFRYEPGRRSPRSRSVAMRRRIRRAADGDIANLLHEAMSARQEELVRSPPRRKVLAHRLNTVFVSRGRCVMPRSESSGGRSGP